MVAALGCGDTSTAGPYMVESGSQLVPCSAYSAYRCWHDHADRCRLNEGIQFDLEDQCYRGNRKSLNCTDRADCVEGEWFAESRYGEPMLVVGCVNDPPPDSSMIANPSESLRAAASISCGEIFLERREACRALSVEECAEESGCRVEVDDVIDYERFCDTGEDTAYCEYPSNVVTLSVIEWEPCP